MLGTTKTGTHKVKMAVLPILYTRGSTKSIIDLVSALKLFNIVLNEAQKSKLCALNVPGVGLVPCRLWQSCLLGLLG